MAGSILGDRRLAFVPIAFMAWGDSVAGIARTTIWRSTRAGIWPSIAMLGVCLSAAALFQPYWIGTVGALCAALSERFSPMVVGVRDDNWTVAAASLASWLCWLGR